MKNKKTTTVWAWGRVMATLCAAVVTLAATAASITVNGINYTTKGTNATVAKYTITKASGDTPADTAFYTGDIVIPEVITHDGTDYTVVATAANAFLDCKDVTSISLPATCVTIGRNSFKGCTGITVSPIPATATSVGSGVLNGCTSLEEVTIVPGWNKPISEELANCSSLKRLIIADGTTDCVMKASMFGSSDEARTAMKSIEYLYMGRNVDASAYTNAEQPFHNLTALKTLEVAGTTTTIQATTFLGCSALNSVTFGGDNAVNSIGMSAFSGCSSLPSIALPQSVTVINQSTFYNCTSLSSITMSDNVTSIGITAFYNTALTSIDLPSALTSIGANAFQKSKLTGKLTLPNKVSSVGTQAFAETNLEAVVIPASVTTIGDAAFAPIAPLADITLDSGNTRFTLDNGVLLSADGTRLLVCAHEGSIGTSYSNATVTSIDSYGLAYAPFQSVDLPALASIGNYGFAYSDLQSFTLESSVSVGLNVFEGSALQTIVIAEGRNEIPQGLCANCPQLTSVTLPTTTTNMMRNCFDGCTALEEMEIPANVNYMEPGSVPATIRVLRVLNVNTPALAAGVFTADQGDVICKVAPGSVEKFKSASQWCYLNIVADETISGEASSLGCPTGLYFATTDGSLMYKDENGNIVNTNFNAGAHAFMLQSYKNRVYVANAGEKFTYQDPSQPLGDGELFYVNNTDGIFYRVTVLNNVGYAPSEDPFTMFIDESENKIYVSDRNVGVHVMDADTTGLYGSQPFLFENNWLPYYNDEISWGAITGGFARDSHGIYWMSKKFNGLCLLRFSQNDLYSDGGAGKPKSFNALFKDVIIKTFYIDEENGYLYMHVQKDAYGSKPGIYRIALSKIENMETGADVEGNENLMIADCELLDSSPIKVEGTESSGEISCVAQITGDGENIYWSYIAPASDDQAIQGSDPLDVDNPLHHSGIKCIGAKPDAEGNMPATVTFAVEGVEAYGVCGATYVSPTVITLSDSQIDVKVRETHQLEATVEPETVLDKTVLWTSSDEAVATVDENGVVTGVTVGTATVTATLQSDPTVQAVCVVNVVKGDGGTGDVNSDGEVTIADVNAIIDIILGATVDDETMSRADVNGDGEVTIADVNAVIDIILGSE